MILVFVNDIYFFIDVVGVFGVCIIKVKDSVVRLDEFFIQGSLIFEFFS